MTSEALINNIKIRPFEFEKDAESVKSIITQVWTGGDDALMEERFGIIEGKPWNEWMGSSVLSYLKAETERSFVAEENDKVVGFCSYVIDHEKSRGTVGYNAVDPACQGHGLGSAMINFVMCSIRKEGVKYATVIVADNEKHEAARRIYQKHGFENLMGFHCMTQKL